MSNDKSEDTLWQDTLRHVADDHPCCKISIDWVIDHVEDYLTGWEDEYNSAQGALGEMNMTLLAREGEIDSMSEQITDLKEQYKAAIASRDEQMLIRGIAERAMLTGSCGEYIQRLADLEETLKLQKKNYAKLENENQALGLSRDAGIKKLISELKDYERELEDKSQSDASRFYEGMVTGVQYAIAEIACMNFKACGGKSNQNHKGNNNARR